MLWLLVVGLSNCPCWWCPLGIENEWRGSRLIANAIRTYRHISLMFDVRKDILLTVYQTLMKSVISFNITSWYSFLTSRCKGKLARIIMQASKITSIQQKQLSDLHTQAVERKTNSILLDPSHPLHGCFELLPSGRRYRVPLAKKILDTKSFILHTHNILLTQAPHTHN